MQIPTGGIRHHFILQEIALFLDGQKYAILGEVCGYMNIPRPSSSIRSDGVKMNEFGEFDRSTLESNIQGNLADRYSEAFSFLLNEEKEMMQAYLDRKRADAIESGLNRILEKQKLPS